MITTLAKVKLIARMYDRAGSGAPTNSTPGELLDNYLDKDTGLSYVLDAIDDGPPVVYTWTQVPGMDDEIELYIPRAESDYLAIRGIPFDEDDGDPVYPASADIVAAEMVCYLTGIGRFDGRGKMSESLSSRQAQYEPKIKGYPISIVGQIDRYQSAV
jgi:hypothetical protein